MNLTSKTQIDRLGDRLRKGQIGDDELRQLDELRRSFADAYEEVVRKVRDATEVEPTGRPSKSTTSIVEKLRRETMRLSQMQDIAGCRLVVQEIMKQEEVVAQLAAAFSRPEIVDRRKQPSHGYRAVHIIAIAKGKPVEIQVRTELQHLWAQLSEKASDVLDPGIKYGGGDPEFQAIMSEASEMVGETEELDLEFANVKGREGESAELQEHTIALKQFVTLKKEIRENLEQSIARLETLSRRSKRV